MSDHRDKCEGLAPFCCNNPECPVHGERIDPAELDAARFVGDLAEAELATLKANLDTWLAEAEQRGRDEVRARVEAVLDEWEAAAEKPMPKKAATESERDQGVRIGVWHSVKVAARELRAALDSHDPTEEAQR